MPTAVKTKNGKSGGKAEKKKCTSFYENTQG
jgi:hypothetical protein